MIIGETKRGIAVRTYHIETIKHPTHIQYRENVPPLHSDHQPGLGPYDIRGFLRKQVG